MLYAFVKVFYDALQFPYGVVKNQHFQSSYFGGRRGSQKRVSLCMSLVMSTIILDDP